MIQPVSVNVNTKTPQQYMQPVIQPQPYPQIMFHPPVMAGLVAPKPTIPTPPPITLPPLSGIVLPKPIPTNPPKPPVTAGIVASPDYFKPDEQNKEDKQVQKTDNNISFNA